ncbi:MAG: cysteine--tRNA ligase [Nanoarchaeota archaeon]
MGKICLYNTLARKKEIFKPIKKSQVGMYTCGPTVYWYQHIGNLRTYIFSDILKRVLLYNKYKVKHIMNVTDVGHLTSDSDQGEDKIEKAAAKEGKTAQETAEFYLNIFKEDLKKLNIISPTVWSKATANIPEQIELIKKLEKKKYTYKTSDGIYFNSSKFKDYGRLAKISIKGLKAGKRVLIGEKKHKTDFALWKFSEEAGKRQQEWNSPWGIGFPGWHIECSAMSIKYLGKHFDIHTGGEDHIQIHHQNEIAQSESATGKKFVNYWLHGAFLLNNEGKKVSKSTGGLYTISELESLGYKPLDFRYLCSLVHYKKPLNFTLENLDSAKNAYGRLKRKIIELKKTEHKGKDLTKEYKNLFLEAVNEDLNIPKAIQIVWEILDDFNFDPKKKLKLLEKFDEVLGLDIEEIKEEKINLPEEILNLLEKREKLREQKKWAEADIIRKRIIEKGYIIEDTPSGMKIEKSS